MIIMKELWVWERPEIKRHLGSTDSISDLVGDLVQGCVRSSSLGRISAETRIGLGTAMALSWLLATRLVDAGGGVFRRRTPTIISNCQNRNFQKEFVMWKFVNWGDHTFAFKNHFKIWFSYPWPADTQVRSFWSNDLKSTRKRI